MHIILEYTVRTVGDLAVSTRSDDKAGENELQTDLPNLRTTWDLPLQQ